MNLGEKLQEVRRDNGLRQEDLADKLFVTRQAVSRWENGETTPTAETLKRIFELYNIDANSFFGTRETAVQCQSCAMPLLKTEDFGTNVDKTVNTEFCTYCFQDGKFSNERSIDEMVESNLKFLSEFNTENGTNFTPDEARSVLKLHLSSLKRWKK